MNQTSKDNQDTKEQVVLNCIKDLDHDATVKNIAILLDSSEGSISGMLSHLVDNGKVKQTRDNIKGIYRYQILDENLMHNKAYNDMLVKAVNASSSPLWIGINKQLRMMGLPELKVEDYICPEAYLKVKGRVCKNSNKSWRGSKLMTKELGYLVLYFGDQLESFSHDMINSIKSDVYNGFYHNDVIIKFQKGTGQIVTGHHIIAYHLIYNQNMMCRICTGYESAKPAKVIGDE